MKTAYYEKSQSFEGAVSLTVVNNMAPVHLSPSQTGELVLVANYGLASNDEEPDFTDFYTLKYENGKIILELEELDYSLFANRNTQIKLEILIPQVENLYLEGENHPYSISGIDADIDLKMENGPSIFSNCTGNMVLESENGPIKIHNHKGNVNVSMENGPLSTDGLSGDSLKVTSENGAIKMRSCSYPNVRIDNENGVIFYETLPVENGDLSFQSENGVISLVLPNLWGFELRAETEMGIIKNKLGLAPERDEEVTIFRSGEMDSKISVKTENGMIKLSYDEHLNLDFLRGKLDQLREAVKNLGSPEDKEKVKKLVENLSAYLNKGIGAIQEDKIREAIREALTKLKEISDNFDMDETRDKVSATVEKLATELQDTFKEFVHKFKSEDYVKQFKEGFKDPGKHHFAFHFDSDMGDKISEKVLKTIKKVAPGVFEMKTAEKEQVAEQSRLKILQMLESGKITAEDAERLLKAISKE
ncbi:MAG: DUF4097 family beta strand repeat-containing protein [Candidatus Cloacimonadota bacterium]